MNIGTNTEASAVVSTENQIMAPNKGFNAYTLKLIAILGMTLDHVGIAFGDYLPLFAKSLLYAFGGLTFPIMAYLLGEGYRYTKNFRSYVLRLLIFAVITQIPYSWALYGQLNILFTLLLGLLAIRLIEKSSSRVTSVIVVIIFTFANMFCDWPLMGVPMVLIYYYQKNPLARVTIPVILPYVLIGLDSAAQIMIGQDPLIVLPEILYVVVGCSLSIPLLYRYNGQRGKPSKYFFYIYYPAHLVVIAVLRGLIFSDWG